MMVVLVSTARSRPRDLPDASRLPRRPRALPSAATGSPARGARSSPRQPYDRPRGRLPRRRTFAVTRRGGRARRRARRPARSRGLGYTADVDEAVAARRRGRADGGVPAARRRGSRTSSSVARARRGDAAEDDLLLPKLTERPPLPPAMTRLARALPRVRSRTCDGALEALPTRAEREPVVGAGRGRRRHDRDRRSGRGRGRRAARGAGATTSCSSRRSSASVNRARRRRPRRRRPDRRLAEREARHPVLLALARRRRRADDGRRRLRLRLRLRHGRGVDGEPRRRRVARRAAARRGEAEGPDRDPLVRGDAHSSIAEQAPARRRARAPAAGDGLARALALPPRGRARRRASAR